MSVAEPAPTALDLSNPLAVALDTSDLGAAVALAERLRGHVGMVKVGLELFAAHGPRAVEALREHAPVFLDLKLHDIPTQVGRACEQIGRLGAVLVTVHASGGSDMIAAAAAGLADGAEKAGLERPRLVAVSVLTSLSDEDLVLVGQPGAHEQVPRLARVAVEAGADGLVCAPRDLTSVRRTIGAEPLLVTPGVRPEGAGADDHARGATPVAAIAAGADILVIGRPITRAEDPVGAATAIVGELTSA